MDAARPRIVLYLLVSMAPFAILAPLVGPIIDRVRGGQRAVVALTCVARAAACFALAGNLETLAFYPLAFAVLVLGKTYSVAKSAVVPRLVEAAGLVAANSRLSRVATIGGLVGALVATGILSLADARWVVASGGVVYLAAMAASLRLRRPRPTRSFRSP